VPWSGVGASEGVCVADVPLVRPTQGLSGDVPARRRINLCRLVALCPFEWWRGRRWLARYRAKVRQCAVWLTDVCQNVVAGGRVEEVEGRAGRLAAGPTAEGRLDVVPGHLFLLLISVLFSGQPRRAG